MKRQYLLFAIALVTSLVGCSTTTSQDALGQRYVSAPGGWNSSPRSNARAEANSVCSANGGGIQIDREFQNGLKYEIYFRCFDYAASLAAKRREEDAKLARELAQEREQQRIAEQERKAQEDEWERTRPQREAAERESRIREQARLTAICPMYYLARQSCASAPNPNYCINIRIGKNYSSWDDQTCFNK